MNEPTPGIPWEKLSTEEACRLLGVEPERGLSASEATSRLVREGANLVAQQGRPGRLVIFIRQFQSAVVLLLLLATLLSVWLRQLLDAAAIFAALLLNALIGFVTEYQASVSLASLKRITLLRSRTLRDGQEEEICAGDLVSGDVVLLAGGDRVPADGRILESEKLLVDESPLTGESYPVEKNNEAVIPFVPLAEKKCLLFAGSTVLDGTAKFLITTTGARSELGRIGKLIAAGANEQTPLEGKLDELGKHLLAIVGVLATFITGIGFLHGEPFGPMLETGIVLAIAAVPEGLPIVASIALAVGMRRMIERKVLVRRLSAVESLGAVTVICSDKTGTMTCNSMTVRELVTMQDRFAFTGQDGYSPEGEVLANGEKNARNPRALGAALRVGVLANDAALEWGKEEGWHIHGDPSEAALLVAARKGGLDLAEEKRAWARLSEIPFESRRKRMSVVCRSLGQDKPFVFSKGAADVILQSCDRVLTEEGEKIFSEELRSEMEERILSLLNGGMRVLALAYKELAGGEDPERNLVLAGVAAMNDPPKPGVKEAISQCHRAGIRTVMITGDHPITARAIAGELGLTEDRLPQVAVDPKEGEPFEQFDIFARTTSEAKLRIVSALKEKGEIVAMTGDGVNDAPALQAADIGIAMGAGADVAKEAAAMVLLDNNFVSIVEAIKQGRIVYANIRKALAFLLTCSFSVMAVITCSIALDWSLPLLPLQILWLNLLIHVFPALGLALQPGDGTELTCSPAPPEQPILSRGVARRILVGTGLTTLAGLTAYGWAIARYGPGLQASSIALVSLAFLLLAHAVSSQSDLPWRANFNPALLLAVLLVVSLQVFALHSPFLQSVLRTAPLSFADWSFLAILIAGFFFLDETFKVWAL